jgi:hypothetical protein
MGCETFRKQVELKLQDKQTGKRLHINYGRLTGVFSNFDVSKWGLLVSDKRMLCQE